MTKAAETEPPVQLELAGVRRAADGDAKAQAWLAGRVIERVRRITRSLARGSADADDAAQLSLIAILRSAKTFRGESSLEHWAGKIAVRTTLRHLGRERKRTDAAPLSEAMAAPQPGAAERLADALPRHVRHYLAQLPEPQREAIVLHHALGYSIDEVGQLLGQSPNTIKGRLRLGTKALRKLVRREQKIGAPKGPRR